MKYNFHGFEVDTELGLSNQSGEQIPIPPKAFSFLCYLLENPNRIVTKVELINAVWDERGTSDNAITACVREVRKVLSDVDREIIKTFPKRGYLLKLETNDVELDEPPTIAIYPFSSRSTDKQEKIENICHILEEEIYTSICRTKTLPVIARQTIASMVDSDVSSDEICKSLNINYLIEGNIALLGSAFRLDLNLRDKYNEHIFIESYKGEIENIISTQEDISTKVINFINYNIFKIEFRSTIRKTPRNLNAYENYIRSLPHIWKMKKESNKIAVQYLNRACEIDSQYGSAIAMKSWCIAQSVIYAWSSLEDREINIEVANNLANEALDRDSSNPLILTIYGTAKSLLGDLENARIAVSRSIEIDPNSPWSWNRMGWIEGYDCKPDKSIECFNKALLISPYDPMNFNCYFGVAQAHFVKHEYQESLKWINRALDKRNDATFIYRLKAACCFYLDMKNEARESVEKIVSENSSITSRIIGNLVPYVDMEVKVRLVDGLVGAGLREK